MIATAAPAAATRLLEGPVGRAGGVVVVDGLPDTGSLAALQQEASSCFAGAERQEVLEDDQAAGRGGTPARRLSTAGAGPVQDALYDAPWLAVYLSSLCGATISPTGTRGSYSYYAEPGDRLGLHLDIETCDVTVITVLRADEAADPSAGGLLVHAAHLGRDLHEVRAAPKEGLGLVRAIPGQSVVLLGGLLPHETVPVAAGQVRVISALCFAAG